MLLNGVNVIKEVLWKCVPGRDSISSMGWWTKESWSTSETLSGVSFIYTVDKKVTFPLLFRWKERNELSPLLFSLIDSFRPWNEKFIDQPPSGFVVDVEIKERKKKKKASKLHRKKTSLKHETRRKRKKMEKELEKEGKTSRFVRH